MQYSRSVSELLAGRGKTLAALRLKSQQRSLVLEQVCAALPERLARAVVSAGIDHGTLSIGVAGAVWATRLRFLAETLRKRVGESTGIDVLSVRVRVAAPRG